MKFFLDNNLSPVFAQALTALSQAEGHTVAALRDKFRPNTPDEDWLPILASEGDWAIVCGDLRIFKLPLLRAIWDASKLTTFFLQKGWTNQPFWDQAWWLVRWWPIITAAAVGVQPGIAYEVPAKPAGKLRLLPGIHPKLMLGPPPSGPGG